MIRIGIPGYPGSGTGPSWICSRFVNRYGAANISGIGLGEDIALSGADVDTWPLRVGTGALANLTASRFTRTIVSGRYFLTPGTVNQKALGLDNSVAFKTIIAVAYGTPAVNAYETIAAPYSADEPLTRNASNETFFGGNWTRSIDGDTPNVTKNIPTTGAHVFHAYNAASTSTGIRVGGSSAALRTWPVSIGFFAFINATPSVTDIAADVADLRRFYSGVLT